MRLLLLNPNTSDFVTATVVAQARRVARPDTEITAITGTFGARVIATRSELAIAEHATLDALAHHADGHDAIVLAVSYDTALLAAREMLPIPVVGITEAALLTACMVGTRIGVVMFGKRVLALYQEIAARHGMAARIAGWRAIEHTAPYAQGDQTESDRLLVEAVQSLVDTEACEVVVLAGAVMAGVPQRLQARVPVPLLDGVSCAIPHAEMLVRLGLPKAQTGSLAPLPAREVVGVSDALRDRLR
jgi:allantoin racemase